MTSAYVVIAGGIGTGKTTLVRLLGTLLTDSIVLEEIRGTYLADFYNDPKNFAFRNQLDYSLQYLEQAACTTGTSRLLIQERSIYDTHQVFSQMQLDARCITDRDFGLLDRLYRVTAALLSPALLVLLETDIEVAFERIVARANPSESDITRDYVDRLAVKYREWFQAFSDCPKVSIKTDHASPTVVAEEVAQLIRKIADLPMLDQSMQLKGAN